MCVPKCDIFWSYKISYKFVTPKYYPIMCILYVTHLRLDFKAIMKYGCWRYDLNPNNVFWELQNHLGGFGTVWKNNTFFMLKLVGGRGH